VPRQTLLSEDVALEGPARQRHLFLAVEQRNARDLIEVQVEALTPFVYRPGDLRRAERTPLSTSTNGHEPTPIPSVLSSWLRPSAVIELTRRIVIRETPK
jgi:hypothetical protein